MTSHAFKKAMQSPMLAKPSKNIAGSQMKRFTGFASDQAEFPDGLRERPRRQNSETCASSGPLGLRRPAASLRRASKRFSVRSAEKGLPRNARIDPYGHCIRQLLPTRSFRLAPDRKIGFGPPRSQPTRRGDESEVGGDGARVPALASTGRTSRPPGGCDPRGMPRG